MIPISRRQHLLFRLVAVPTAAVVAAHVVFQRQFPWQSGYRFPLSYFLTVATVMLCCWQVNVWVYNALDERHPFHRNPTHRIGWQLALGGSLTLLTFLLVFPNAIRLYTGVWPSSETLVTGLVVCATIATIINGIFIALYLIQTVYREQPLPAEVLNTQLAAPLRPTPRERLLIEAGNRQLHLHPQEIAYFFSSGGMVLLVTADGQQVTTSYNAFSKLADQLPDSYFFQLNRQYITGLNAIRSVEDDVNRKLVVHLVPAMHKQQASEPVTVSRYRSAELRKWLEQSLPA